MKNMFVLTISFMIFVTSCNKKEILKQDNIPPVSIPTTELDIVMAISFNIDNFLSSQLYKKLPSLKTINTNDLISLFQTQYSSCIFKNTPSFGWILIPRGTKSGAIVLVSINTRKVITCLKNMGVTLIKGKFLGAQLNNMAYFVLNDNKMLILPTQLLPLIHIGEGIIGSGKLLKRMPKGFFNVTFVKIDLLDKNTIKMIQALAVQQKNLAEKIMKQKPNASGSLNFLANNYLEISLVLDFKDEDSGKYIAEKIAKWIQTSGYNGDVFIDHGALKMVLKIQAHKLNAFIARIIARIKHQKHNNFNNPY